MFLCIYALYSLGCHLLGWCIGICSYAWDLGSVLVGESKLVMDLADGDASVGSKLSSVDQNGVTKNWSSTYASHEDLRGGGQI